MEELFRERIDGIGWVALRRFPDGEIVLYVRGYEVWAGKAQGKRPELALVE